MKYGVLLVVLLLAGCRTEKPPRAAGGVVPDGNELRAGDKDTVAILSYDRTNAYFYQDSRVELFGNATNAVLTPQELHLVDSLLRQSVAASNSYQRQRGYTGPALNPNGYRRQLIAVTNAAGETEVWANCFCAEEGEHLGWQHRIVAVSGGGNCFFSVRLNLSRRTWGELNLSAEY